MKTKSYDLCVNALGEIIGGEIQFSVDVLKRIVKEEGSTIADLSIEAGNKFIENVEFLDYANKELDSLRDKLYEWETSMKVDKGAEVWVCKTVSCAIDKFVSVFNDNIKSLKELEDNILKVKKTTDVDTTELELLIKYGANKRISKNFDDKLFDRVEEANQLLKQHIQMSQKSSKR